MSSQAPFRQIVRQRWRIVEGRLAERIVHDGDIGERGRCSNSNTKRLAERFLGGETLGQKARRVVRAREVGALGGRHGPSGSDAPGCGWSCGGSPSTTAK